MQFLWLLRGEKMNISKIGVIGAGQMGHGIALVSAQAGFDVIIHDTTDDFVKKGIGKIEKFLYKSVEKGKISTDDKNKVMKKISGTTKLDELKNVDLIIEAIFENIEVKKQLFQKLEKVCKKECIFASNTSTIPITDLASVTTRPEKFIGMHFMNPVPLMKLVEVIRGLKTNDDTTKIIKELSEKIGKIPVEVNDGPGFVSNRLLMPMINEAIYCYMEGIGNAENIDNVMKLGMNHPMGPLELADLIGLDVVLNIMTVLYEGFNVKKWYKQGNLEEKQARVSITMINRS